jgi:hypothetical protein
MLCDKGRFSPAFITYYTLTIGDDLTRGRLLPRGAPGLDHLSEGAPAAKIVFTGATLGLGKRPFRLLDDMLKERWYFLHDFILSWTAEELRPQ